MRQNLCCDYFAFIWTQVIEVVMWQVQYTQTIGWGSRVYGYGLGSVLMVEVEGQVLGLLVQCLELQFT